MSDPFQRKRNRQGGDQSNPKKAKKRNISAARFGRQKNNKKERRRTRQTRHGLC